MEQVKIISGENKAEVEDEINKFLSKQKKYAVNYINFQVTPYGQYMHARVYTAMISYETEDKYES